MGEKMWITLKKGYHHTLIVNVKKSQKIEDSFITHAY